MLEKNIYNNRTILELELQGFNTITQLLDIMNKAFETDLLADEVKFINNDPYNSYIRSRVSENYIRNFKNFHKKDCSQYNRKLYQYQLMTDMISGMTDNYAVSLLEELQSFK